MYKLWKKYLPAGVKYRAMVGWYNLLSRLETGDDLLFLNHGFAPPEGDPETVALDEGDEKHRYSIQLYNHLASRTGWTGKDALEVSSGRGGGCDWIVRTFRPRSMVGLDIADKSTQFCRDRHRDEIMRFETGDAQAMPFADASFDIVINVESSLNYPDLGSFLGEVDRVLRPGGHFLIADYRRPKRAAELKDRLLAMRYEVERMEDISAEIARGTGLSAGRKRAVIERYLPRPLHAVAAGFAGLEGDGNRESEQFHTGVKVYQAAVLVKPG